MVNFALCSHRRRFTSTQDTALLALQFRQLLFEKKNPYHKQLLPPSKASAKELHLGPTSDLTDARECFIKFNKKEI